MESSNMPFSIHIDGTGLTLHETHIGGHPEWAEDSLLIGCRGDDQILYDVDEKKIVDRLGTPEIFPDPEGAISLSPDRNWFVNGYKQGDKNYICHLPPKRRRFRSQRRTG